MALIFTYGKTFLSGRKNILLGHRQRALRCKDQADADRTIASFTEVLTSFSKFVDGLTMQGTLKYTGHFSGPNRLRVEN